jgi:hypothetical protein
MADSGRIVTSKPSKLPISFWILSIEGMDVGLDKNPAAPLRLRNLGILLILSVLAFIS